MRYRSFHQASGGVSFHTLQVFFHKYFSRKNRKQLARRDNASEETGSELEAVSDEDDANSEQEIDEGESSDPEEDAVWKVRTLSVLFLLLSCSLPGYASYHAA